jgi:dihydrofolate reductase
MGRLVYWMNVSTDLKIELAENEQGEGDWMRITEPLHREFNTRARALAMMIQGRVIYETMETFWPAARENEDFPDYIREYGEIWTSCPKVLVSRTRTSADYDTAIVGGDNAIEQLAAVRAGTEGDIGVGGATIATQLLQADLLDELMLFTHPVILGGGRPLFDGDILPVELDLLEHATYEEGVTLQRYGVKAARGA